VGGIYLIKLFCQYGAQYSLNALHFYCAQVTGPGATLEFMAERMFAVLGPPWKALMSTSGAIWGVSAERVKPVPTLAAHTTDAPQLGTGSANPAPPQVSAYLTTYSGQKGRAYRGRVYLPFIDIALIDNTGRLSAAGLTKVQAVGDLLDTAIVVNDTGGSTTLAYGVYHKATGKIDIMNSYKTHVNLGTQVRRSLTHKADRPPW